MSKRRPSVKVSDMPFVDSLSELSVSERRKYGIITSTGIINAYRRAFIVGQGASRKDETWDKSQHIHTCCESKVPWRHRTACKLLNFEDES